MDKSIDALGDVRARIRALEAEEKQLRQQLLAQGPGTFVGARFRVRIEEKSQKRFSKDRLPPDISNDPTYWLTEKRTYVRVFPLENAPKARPVPRLVLEEDDFEVIEDWPDQNKKYRCAIGNTSAG